MASRNVAITDALSSFQLLSILSARQQAFMKQQYAAGHRDRQFDAMLPGSKIIMQNSEPACPWKIAGRWKHCNFIETGCCVAN